MFGKKRKPSSSTTLVPWRPFGIPDPAIVVDRYGRTNLTLTAEVIDAHTRVLRAAAQNVRARTELEAALASYRRQQALIEFIETLSPKEQAYYEASLRSGR